MLDLHCHLLPGIDDGPETLDEALELARHAVSSGIKTAVVTPHYTPHRYENTLAGIRECALQFRAELLARGIPLVIGYAAEVRISEEVVTLEETGALPVLGSTDGYRILLMELPDSHIPPGTDKLISWLMNRKIRPLIAHPERNKDIMRDIEKVGPLVKLGCWLQLTGGSICGVFGPVCRQRSKQILERGWATVIASDAHNMTARKPELEPARKAAEDIVGELESWHLVRERPAKITASNEGLMSA
jgi:protein-tyrosine phosphatase